MSRIDKLIDYLNDAGPWLALIFAISMFFYPLFSGGGSWAHVHAVWMEWQTLNMGVLAFGSSLIAFNISRYHVNQQRQRDLMAARSVLPDALSELMSYFRECAITLKSALEIVGEGSNSSVSQADLERPVRPEGYKDVLSRCISLADRDVAEHLSRILMKLQILNSRVEGLTCEMRPDSRTIFPRAIITTYLYQLGELYALTAQIFPYSRGLAPFQKARLKWDNFQTSYFSLKIDDDEVREFTKRAILRAESEES